MSNVRVALRVRLSPLLLQGMLIAINAGPALAQSRASAHGRRTCPEPHFRGCARRPQTLLFRPRLWPRRRFPGIRLNYAHAWAHITVQDEVYDKCVEPMVAKWLDGFHATIFAYGQTVSH
jgi:hypothetical protein